MTTCRSTSSSLDTNKRLEPNFVTGFCDAESSFVVN
jgi:hypothetical protein